MNWLKLLTALGSEGLSCCIEALGAAAKFDAEEATFTLEAGAEEVPLWRAEPDEANW